MFYLRGNWSSDRISDGRRELKRRPAQNSI